VTRVVLAGGGLANSLIAWRLRARRPEAEIIVVEQGEALGGNHTWSFHHGDVSAAQHQWLAPLVAREWSAQSVRFPAHERRLGMAYYSITSARLHQVLSATLGSGVRLGARISELRADGVRLASGAFIAADLVIDGRGAGPVPGLRLAWQKFLGQELRLDAPHGLEAPLLMAATVAQLDGYRFVYLLPLSADRLLVEDTYYSDSPELDAARLRERVAGYVHARGWRVADTGREETGVLPIVLDGDPQAAWADAEPGVARSGMRALLFHHTTGYSLPDAVRLAEDIAAAPDLSGPAIAARVRELSLQRWREQRFFRLLNRLMFEAATPALRYRTLEHFYRLPESLIGRFYAGRLSLAEQLRVLTGRPPVPLGAALRCLARSARPQRPGLAHGGRA